MFEAVYHAVVGLALLVGLGSVAWTLPKVKSHWRGAYWLGVGLALTMILAFGASAAINYAGWHLSPKFVLYSLETSIAFTALELILVPYIHRRERELEVVVEEIAEENDLL